MPDMTHPLAADGAMARLRLMLADMDAAPPEFRPTNFWSRGVRALVSDLEAKGFDSFRDLPSALSYFVPSYAEPFYQRHRGRIDGMLRRLSRRKAPSLIRAVSKAGRGVNDYRLFRATTTGSALGLDRVSESDIGGGERIRIGDRDFSRSMLNYLRALTLLERNTDVSTVSAWMEIGGGYGTLGEIVLKGRDDAFFVNVDIPPVAAVSTWYLKQVFGPDAVLGYEDSRTLDRIDLAELRRQYRAVILCPWQLPRVEGQVDAFANFISFQEMEPDVVANYVRLVQPLTRQLVVMRNSVQGKTIAHQAGAAGTLRAVTTDATIAAFDQFDRIASDSLIHGDESADHSFRSEVNVLKRRGT